MKKENVSATVVSCIPTETVINGTASRCFEITVEFRSSNGIVSRSFKRGNAVEEGTTYNMCYYPNSGAVEMATGNDAKVKNIPILVGVVVSLLVIAVPIVLVSLIKGFDGETFAYLFAIIMFMGFLWVGIYFVFILPKKKRNTENCIIYEGRICKYVKTNNGIWWSANYSAVYEYIHNGKMCRVGSGIEQNKRKKIGTKVTIALNEETGEAFCVEETREYYVWGVIIIVVFLSLITLFIVQMLTL